MFKVYAAGVILAALLGLFGWQRLVIGNLETDLATAKAEHASDRMRWAVEREDATEAALVQSEDYRQQEDEWRRAIQESRDEADRTKRDAARVAAAFRAERVRLDTALADYAAGRGSAEAAAASCDQRAGALGSALASALRTEEGLVDQLEDRTADTRLLLASWPRKVKLGQPG